MLEMRPTPSSRKVQTNDSHTTLFTTSSNTALSNHHTSTNTTDSEASANRYRPPLIRTPSGLTDRDRATIAPIAPTMLKTMDVDDEEDDTFVYATDASDHIGSSGAHGLHVHCDRDNCADSAGDGIDYVQSPVELVYAPPLGSNYQVDFPSSVSSLLPFILIIDDDFRSPRHRRHTKNPTLVTARILWSVGAYQLFLRDRDDHGRHHRLMYRSHRRHHRRLPLPLHRQNHRLPLHQNRH